MRLRLLAPLLLLAACGHREAAPPAKPPMPPPVVAPLAAAELLTLDHAEGLPVAWVWDAAAADPDRHPPIAAETPWFDHARDAGELASWTWSSWNVGPEWRILGQRLDLRGLARGEVVDLTLTFAPAEHAIAYQCVGVAGWMREPRPLAEAAHLGLVIGAPIALWPDRRVAVYAATAADLPRGWTCCVLVDHEGADRLRGIARCIGAPSELLGVGMIPWSRLAAERDPLEAMRLGELGEHLAIGSDRATARARKQSAQGSVIERAEALVLANDDLLSDRIARRLNLLEYAAVAGAADDGGQRMEEMRAEAGRRAAACSASGRLAAAGGWSAVRQRLGGGSAAVDAAAETMRTDLSRLSAACVPAVTISPSSPFAAAALNEPLAQARSTLAARAIGRLLGGPPTAADAPTFVLTVGAAVDGIRRSETKGTQVIHVSGRSAAYDAWEKEYLAAEDQRLRDGLLPRISGPKPEPETTVTRRTFDKPSIVNPGHTETWVEVTATTSGMSDADYNQRLANQQHWEAEYYDLVNLLQKRPPETEVRVVEVPVAYQFWNGEVSRPVALASRDRFALGNAAIDVSGCEARSPGAEGVRDPRDEWRTRQQVLAEATAKLDRERLPGAIVALLDRALVDSARGFIDSERRPEWSEDDELEEKAWAFALLGLDVTTSGLDRQHAPTEGDDAGK